MSDKSWTPQMWAKEEERQRREAAAAKIAAAALRRAEWIRLVSASTAAGGSGPQGHAAFADLLLAEADKRFPR